MLAQRVGEGEGEGQSAAPLFFEELLDGMQLYRLLSAEGEVRDFVVTRSNRAFAELTHLGDCANRRGREIAAFGDAFPVLLELFARVAGSGTAQRKEVSLPTWPSTFQVSAYRISKDTVAAQWAPVTTDPQQTRALREITQHVRFLIEHVPAAVAVFDRDMRYLAVSRRYIQDYRLIRDDLIGHIHYEVVPEAELFRDVHSRCLRGETLSGREEPFPRPDGTVDSVTWEMRPWYDDNGAIGGVVLFSEVVTEAKRAQRELEESVADREGLFAFAATGIARADPETRRLLEVNPYFCDFLGYTSAELLSMNIDDFTHPDDRELDRNMFLAARREERSVFQYEKRYLRKDGEVRWGRVTLTIVRRPEGSRRTIATIQDITEQRASHAALSLQASALDAAANAIAITDPRGIVEYMNPAFAALTGYSREEMCGRTMGLLRSGRQPPAFYATMKETISAGRVWQGELVNRRKDGTLYHESMTITPVRNEQGAISHFIAIKRDISERKRREEIATQLEERHRLALDAVALGTWTLDFDSDGTVTLDERAQQHLNVGYHTAASVEIAASLDPRDVIDSREAMTRAISEGRESFETVMRVKDASGEVRWIAAHARIHRSGDGPPRVFGTSQDITQTRRADEELHRSEERYRLLVDSLEDVVFSANVERRITFISRAITRFGYRPEQLIGRHLHEFIHPADISTVVAARELGNGHSFEYRLMDASGVARPVRSYSHPLIIDGVVAGIIGVVIDQTAQRNIEDQLRASQKMEAVGRLAGGIAHDFNNLLSVILAYSELAMRNLAPTAAERADLEEVRQAAKRAQALTRQLLTFSRRQVVKPEPVDLDELVSSVGKMLKRVIGEDIELCFVSSAERHDVEADRGNLEQLIMNLAVNARDAMPDGGRLTIELGRRELVAADTQAMGIVPGSYVELSVIDTGCGMDETTRARLFEPFFTTKDVGKGTGLGLSTVYGIVQASAGAIVVDSALGKGSTFRVYLPYHARPGDAAPATEQRSGIAARGHETVLVVEDEPALRNVVRRLLQAAGYNVITAPDASAALEICSQTETPIELILTDVIMPGMSGRELVKRLLATHPDMKVVFTSGYTNEMADHAGMPHFLPKPYDWRSLTEMVRSALDGVPPKAAS